MRSIDELSEDERQEALRPFALRQKACPFTADELMRWAILTSLAAFGGNRTYTAKHLKISIRMLRIHIVKYKQEGFFVPESSKAHHACVQKSCFCECRHREKHRRVS